MGELAKILLYPQRSLGKDRWEDGKGNVWGLVEEKEWSEDSVGVADAARGIVATDLRNDIIALCSELVLIFVLRYVSTSYVTNHQVSTEVDSTKGHYTFVTTKMRSTMVLIGVKLRW